MSVVACVPEVIILNLKGEQGPLVTGKGCIGGHHFSSTSSFPAGMGACADEVGACFGQVQRLRV